MSNVEGANEVRLCVLSAEHVARLDDVALLTGRVEVIGAGSRRGLDPGQAQVDNRPTVLRTTLRR